MPRAWLTVLLLAIVAKPNLALSGLASLMTGKRVRGWNALCLAASAHRNAYRRWIAAAEPYHVRLRSFSSNPARPSLEVVILGAARDPLAAAATCESLRMALGPDLLPWVSGIALEGCRLLPGGDTPAAMAAASVPSQPGAWLLPIQAGDCVSKDLGIALGGANPGDEADLLYWDEDRLLAGCRTQPWIKPDWDPILFGMRDGLTGASLVRIGRNAQHEDPDHATDWPRFLRECANQGRSPPLHLPLVLTHRVAVPASSPAAAPALAQQPISVSVIVPTRDGADLLDACLAGLAKTRFPGPHEIIILDNGSVEPATLALFERLEKTAVARVVACPGPFNFADLTNRGVAEAKFEFVCLLNNDIEVRDPAWLIAMTRYAAMDDVGAVGAKLLFPDGSIQHAGVALGVGDAAGHIEKGIRPEATPDSPWHGIDRTVSAVTGACLLVSRARFLAVGGMDPAAFAVDFNDVDLCLRLAARSWKTVYCAGAVLVHHESKSRGYRRQGADLERFERELANLRERWRTDRIVDPYHSPLFRRQSERCLLAF
ncbi:MAG: hypothetical protein NVS3B5_04060 [Sphingomicrobium sp.]